MGNNGLGYMADEEDLPFEFKALELAIELTISSLDFQVSHTTMCQPGGEGEGGGSQSSGLLDELTLLCTGRVLMLFSAPCPS